MTTIYIISLQCIDYSNVGTGDTGDGKCALVNATCVLDSQGAALSDTLILADRIAGRRFDNSLIYYSDPLA